MADDEIKFSDRRHSSRPSGLIVPTASQASQAMRGRLPREGRAVEVPGDTNRFGRDGVGSDPISQEMRRNRRVASRLQKRASGVGGVGGGGGADISFATGRPRDPMFYWRQNNIPYDVTRDDELKKIRAFCRLLYLTHPIVAACIDIFSKFPLQGMELECKDEQLKDFYSTLFFDQLDYENFLLDVGREYWITGEAWPLGSFNEVLGVWDDEELLNPDDVEVERSPFLKDPRYLIRLPETLRKVLQTRSPRWEYDALMRSYPELAAYSSENALMPVSNVLLNQLKFKGDTFHKRGLPILMRGFRAIVQEEMLNAAMDAVADRLYTPLILAKLGASATDLGTQQPWIPTSGDLEDFEESLDAALSGDFRVLIHHFATDMAPVFGRENMPDMSGDFDRIEDRILQVFGLSRTILQGADSGETYAADALNRDIVTQLLTHYQRHLRQFYEGRALIVAEAQEHFDYDVRNGKRYVKMEEILEVDEETGEQRIVEQPKLLIPDLKFDTMTLQDENTERQFTEALVAAGVPVPYHKRIMGTGMDFDEMIEQRTTEQVALAVGNQETRRETYKALRDGNLPIPQDLLDDFRPKATNAGAPGSPQVTQGGQDVPIPTLGGVPVDNPALAPTPEEMAMAGNPEADTTQPLGMPGGAMPGNVILMPQQGAQGQEEGDQRPPESDEQRAGMPKPAYRVTAGVREAVHKHYTAVDNSIEDEHDEAGNLIKKNPQNYRPEGKFGPPRHVGMRRYVEFEDAEEETG
jgi:hypothetical protein